MRIAVLQTRSAPGDPEAAAARIETAAERAAKQGARILLAPELVVCGYGAGEAIAGLAEPQDGPTARRLGAVARKTGLAVVYGYGERDGEAVYNAARFLAPDGAGANYRKCHLYGEYERSYFAPGNAAPAPFEWSGLRIGLLICYDVEFPESARSLALTGADLVLVPTALPSTSASAYIARRVVPVRAFENQLFIAYADLCGADALFRYKGLSGIAAPDGSDLARAGESDEALLVADLNLNAFEASRAENPYLKDLRRDLFVRS